jgi:hypothetical protein
MKGINTPGQALDSGGVASFSAPRDGVSHLAFPALAPERNHHADSFPLAPLENEFGKVIDEMKNIICIEHTGKARIITPFAGRQLKICEYYGLEIAE